MNVREGTHHVLRQMRLECEAQGCQELVFRNKALNAPYETSNIGNLSNLVIRVEVRYSNTEDWMVLTMEKL